MKTPSLCLATAISCLLLSQPLGAQQPQDLPVEGRLLAMTLYNNDLAFFEESRDAELQEGVNLLAVEGMPNTLIAPSFYMEAEGVTLLSQSLQPATLGLGALLRAYVGEAVGVMLPDPGDSDRLKQFDGRLLSLNGGALVEIDGEVLAVETQALRFPGLPEGLRASDALLLDIESDESGIHPLTLGYLARGFSWQADYVARYDEAAGRLDVTAQASLRNDTPEDFQADRVSLVAGDINRAATPRPPQPMQAEALMMSATAGVAQREPAGEYHRYLLPGPAALPAQSIKQVTFMNAAAVPVTQRYRLEGLVMQGGNRGQVSGPQNAAATLVFDNSAESGLGLPLPAGTWRVYGGSAEGGRLLLGEAAQGHIPDEGEVELLLGRAFDIRGEAAVTDFKRITNRSYEIEQRVTLTNAKPQDAEVEVVGNFPAELRVLSESLPHEMESAGRLIWRVPVAAGGEASLTFRVLVNY